MYNVFGHAHPFNVGYSSTCTCQKWFIATVPYCKKLLWSSPGSFRFKRNHGLQPWNLTVRVPGHFLLKKSKKHPLKPSCIHVEVIFCQPNITWGHHGLYVHWHGGGGTVPLNADAGNPWSWNVVWHELTAQNQLSDWCHIQYMPYINGVAMVMIKWPR